jgi:hypothetical protein
MIKGRYNRWYRRHDMNKIPSMKNKEPDLPDVKRGHDRWKGFLEQWMSEGRPGWIIVGGVQYQVLQEAGTYETFFRPQKPDDMIMSRSF